ncbi:MAG: hypothetical protein ACI8Z9_002145, partial [Paraglaciecola sp.]
FRIQDKRLPLLCKPVLLMNGFIQTDLPEAVLDFVGAIARRLRHFLYSDD